MSHEEMKSPPKVIIFVKDRVVAEYLKNILLKHLDLQKEYKKANKRLHP
jgi:hypothetical protein